VQILRGHTHPRKVVQVVGIDEGHLAEQLQALELS
jgi:uncharacterized protein YggU (UPF0235/DUF167 family)